METPRVRCLILACGNTLRGDDGVGPFLCAWAEERFAGVDGVRAMARQQWSPELAADVAAAEAVIFLDCTLDGQPGDVRLQEITAAPIRPGLVTHHLGAAELLSVARDLYGAALTRALVLTIGASSIELGEGLSPAVQAAIPAAQKALELAVCQALESPPKSPQR